METKTNNLRTAAEVREFLAGQQKTYAGVIALLPNGKKFGTPEGVNEQIENAESWPTNLCFYEIHSATEQPLVVNLTIRAIPVTRAQAATV